MVEALSGTTSRLGANHLMRLPNGRFQLVWENKQPQLNERYQLHWEWLAQMLDDEPRKTLYIKLAK